MVYPLRGFREPGSCKTGLSLLAFVGVNSHHSPWQIISLSETERSDLLWRNIETSDGPDQLTADNSTVCAGRDRA